MANKQTENMVLGSLMRNPKLLMQTDRYNLTVKDFNDKLTQYIFYAIANIAQDGSSEIKSQDIDLFLQPMSQQYAMFKNNNGISLVNDIIELANDLSFDTYYNSLKKENLLRDLSKDGFDTSYFYDINPVTQEAYKLNEKYADLTVTDIMDIVKRKIMSIEKDYLRNDATETSKASDGIRDLIDDLAENPDIGAPLQGEIFNTIVAGARKGKYYIRSGASGVSKTRQAVGDACYLAYPLRYNTSKCKWELNGCNERALFIATEQTRKEIQKMILAYLTGFNESKFRYNKFTELEREVISQAIGVMEAFDNLMIVRMPSPSIEVVKTVVRENVMLHDIEYVFYDYIFICPSLLGEFKGFNLRNDEVLLMFSTALKDLTVELDIFIMTSTQLNASADDNKNIRNESGLSGSRAIVNKADIGCIMARPTNEELSSFKKILEENDFPVPNMVTDMYKVRDGAWTQVRIWSAVDLGTLRKKDLFITNSRLEPVEDFHLENFDYTVELTKEINEFMAKLNRREPGDW